VPAWYNRWMDHIAHILKEKNLKLVVADVATSGGFTQVPNFILRTNALSPGAKLTYAMLLSYAWQDEFCFPGQEKLSEHLGTSLRSTNTYIKELQQVAVLEITRRGQGKTNWYTLHVKPPKKKS